MDVRQDPESRMWGCTVPVNWTKPGHPLRITRRPGKEHAREFLKDSQRDLCDGWLPGIPFYCRGTGGSDNRRMLVACPAGILMW